MKKHHLTLTDDDRRALETLLSKGNLKALTFKRATALLLLDRGKTLVDVAATLAVTGAVVGEFVGANEGLGYVILQANGSLDTAMLFAALIIMSLLGIILFAIIEIAEKLLIPWHASRRTSNSASTAV